MTGIDGSVQMAEEAIRLHPELEGKLFPGVLPEALESSEFRPGGFDVIYAVEVLMHLKPAELTSYTNGVRRVLSGRTGRGAAVSVG